MLLMSILCLITISHSRLTANARVHDHRELTGNGGDLIKKICKETSQEEMNCIRILRADPKVVQARNNFEFSKAILELALKKTKEGQKFLKKLGEKTRSKAIASCANQWYDEAVESFQSALGELKESPMTANYDAKVAGDGPSICEKILAKAHIVNPSISAINHQTLLLSNIAFWATS